MNTPWNPEQELYGPPAQYACPPMQCDPVDPLQYEPCGPPPPHMTLWIPCNIKVDPPHCDLLWPNLLVVHIRNCHHYYPCPWYRLTPLYQLQPYLINT